MISLTFHGVHLPRCVDLDAHIAAAEREAQGFDLTLDDFIDQVRRDWAEEQELADMGDQSVIAYFRQAEIDFAMEFLS